MTAPKPPIVVVADTWVQIQELPEDVWDDEEAVKALILHTEVVALVEIHSQGYRELAPPESRVERAAVPYVDPVTQQTIVGAIRSKVRCVKEAGPA